MPRKSWNVIPSVSRRTATALAASASASLALLATACTGQSESGATKGAHHTDWNLTMAATVLVMAPVILVFFFAQKAFVEGVTLTGVKG